jgi:hypothetical protein
MKSVKFGIAVAAALLSSSAAFAACYDYQVIPASLDCSGGAQGNSADFGTACAETASQLVQITIACPTSPAGSTTSSASSASSISASTREDRDSRAGNQMAGGGGFGSPH